MIVCLICVSGAELLTSSCQATMCPRLVLLISSSSTSALRLRQLRLLQLGCNILLVGAYIPRRPRLGFAFHVVCDKLERKKVSRLWSGSLGRVHPSL